MSTASVRVKPGRSGSGGRRRDERNAVDIRVTGESRRYRPYARHRSIIADTFAPILYTKRKSVGSQAVRRIVMDTIIPVIELPDGTSSSSCPTNDIQSRVNPAIHDKHRFHALTMFALFTLPPPPPTTTSLSLQPRYITGCSIINANIVLDILINPHGKPGSERTLLSE
ncbi:hypothetical protein J6590_030044 [Homalodisca vitripennis]|nr:hypothetical protein J6590_030044 [Homalodisca vitripennis]